MALLNPVEALDRRASVSGRIGPGPTDAPDLAETPYPPAAMEKARPEEALIEIVEHTRLADRSITRILPSSLTGGPWNPGHQHGGAVVATCARFLSRVDAPVPMRIARLTTEMFRGVPVAPLDVETRIIRSGRRIQSVEASLVDPETKTIFARATALRIRETDEIPELEASGERDPALGRRPETAPTMRPPENLYVPEFIRACDLIPGGTDDGGRPGTNWTRFCCRIVTDESPTPIERMAAVLDFASGTFNVMDYTRYSAINPDLTIHVLRPPRSDWIALRGHTLRSADGIGQSEAIAYDDHGPVARIAACLLLGRL
jgi:hypothetical protein